MEQNILDKQKLISELKQIHRELVDIYSRIFKYKLDNVEDFENYIKEQYKESGTSVKDREAWNKNFCHRAAYTLLNKILFVRICEDKGFMRNPEDYVAGEIDNPHIGEKLSKRGLQKWTNLITNYTLGELVKFAFLDMKKSYNNIVLYKDDKYEILNPTDNEFNLKYLEGDKDTKEFVIEFEKVLNDIIEKLDTDKFNFQQADGNILGDVYEKFMDRETRKAIGQFYTPNFVIEHILNNTVAETDVVDMPFVTVADISCGSGHFLIMAYDMLREKFMNNLEVLRNKYADETYTIIKKGKEKTLTGKEYWKKENIHYHLLKHCIYGADIDSFAVQLTTINLLLKDLDNFTDELNIIECDSLIKWEEDYDWQDLKEQLQEEYEIITTSQVNLFGEEEKVGIKQKREKFDLKYKNTSRVEKINREKAKEIVHTCSFWYKKFNFVVGNPPYMGQKGNKELFQKFKNHQYWSNYYERKQDIYYYFMIRGIESLIEGGKLGFINPPYWLTAFASTKLKKYLISNSVLLKVYDFIDYKMFDDAQINGNIFIFRKTKDKTDSILIYEYDKDKRTFNKYISQLTNKQLTLGMWNIFNNADSDYVFNDQECSLLGDIATISPGIQTGSDYVSKSHIDKLELQNVQINEGIFVVSEKEKQEKFDKEDEIYIKPFYKNSDVSRFYSKLNPNKYILITNSINNIQEYPNIKKHLSKYKKILDNRYRNYALKKADEEGKWYALYGYRPNTNFDGPKIITPYRSKTTKFSYIVDPFYASIDVFYINIDNKEYDYLYVLGLLNSSLILYWLDKNCKKKGENFEFYTEPLSNIPIKLASDKQQTAIICIVNEIINIKAEIFKEKDYKVILNSKNIVKVTKEKIENIIILTNKLINKEHELNSQVYNLYNVDEKKQMYINEYLISKKKIDDNLSEEMIINEFNSELISYINDSLGAFMRENFSMKYSTIYDIKELTENKVCNFEHLINFIKGSNITIKNITIVKEILNGQSYTWNAYRKDKIKGRINKTFIKYYDDTYYGVAEWSDEIHKKYFMDAIEEYTANIPNEKKAKDLLKLFKDLDIEDKQDYIEIIEGKIKRAFN